MEEQLSGDIRGLTKKEILQLTRERDKLELSLGGIRDMGTIEMWLSKGLKRVILGTVAVGDVLKLDYPGGSLRLAGRVEDGRPCTSDPALGGPARLQQDA